MRFPANQQRLGISPGLFPTGGVDRAVVRDAHEPGLGLVWNSIRWPGFEGCNQRLAQRILRIGNVAGAPGDVGDQSSIRITRDGFNRIMRGRIRSSLI